MKPEEETQEENVTLEKKNRKMNKILEGILDMYKCGKCNLRGCSNGNMDKLMKICPTREIELQQKAKQLYEEEENRKIAYNAGLVEAEGIVNILD